MFTLIKSRRSSLIAVAVLAACCAANASEADTFCKLADAKAKTASAVLAAPEVFGNVGDPVTAASSMTVGVRKSIGRSKRAELTDRIAVAECAAYRAESRLSEQLDGLENRSELLAMIRSVPSLEKARDLAQKNVATENRLLESHSARLSDVKEAFEQYDNLERELSTLQARRARIQNQLPQIEEPLDVLLEDSINAQSDVADLQGQIANSSAWDVTYAAGVRTDLRDAHQKAFIAVTATYSLGAKESADAASRIGGLTAQLLRDKRDGGLQAFMRAKDTARGLIAAERLTLQSLESRQRLINTNIERVAPLTTTDGERLKRSMAVEALTVTASIDGSQARIAHLSNWLEVNDK